MSAELFDTLAKLGFRISRTVFDKVIEEATKQRLSPVQVLERIAEAERRARDGVNLKRRTRAATLGIVAALDTFDWSHPKKIDKPLAAVPLAEEVIGSAMIFLFRIGDQAPRDGGPGATSTTPARPRFRT